MKKRNIILNKTSRILEIVALFCVDIFMFYFSFNLAVSARMKILPLIYSGFPIEPSIRYSLLWVIISIYLLSFFNEGLYSQQFGFWEEIYASWKALTLATIAIFAFASIGKMNEYLSRPVVILMWLISLVIIPIVRINTRKMLRKIGLFKRRVIIFGTGEKAIRIAQAMKNDSNYGYEIMEFLDDVGERQRLIDGRNVRIGIDRVERYISACNVKVIVLAFQDSENELLRHYVNRFQHKVEKIIIVPEISDYVFFGTEIRHFVNNQMIALEVKNNLESPLNSFIKISIDYLLAFIMIVLFFFPILAIGLAIRIESKGPILFWQYRVGKKGKIFKCFKFRTMYLDAEDRLKRILSEDLIAREEWEKFRKIKNDPRVTQVGKFLRKTSLDELPQLINVFKGEMSLIGPRPVVQEEIDKYYRDAAKLYFSVLPGITGLWQVSGRSDTNYEYRVALDAWYVRNWHPWIDFVILLKTIKVVISGKGAY
jgi:undecaprenyl-phosphate galactose phosphotransferase